VPPSKRPSAPRAKRSVTVTKKPGARTASSRYTAPKPKSAKHSALWVPAAMFACFALGVVLIAANYLELLPGGQAKNEYLFVGLGNLIAGFVLSTQFR